MNKARNPEGSFRNPWTSFRDPYEICRNLKGTPWNTLFGIRTYPFHKIKSHYLEASSFFHMHGSLSKASWGFPKVSLVTCKYFWTASACKTRKVVLWHLRLPCHVALRNALQKADTPMGLLVCFLFTLSCMLAPKMFNSFLLTMELHSMYSLHETYRTVP